jgi:hypothetical protein
VRSNGLVQGGGARGRSDRHSKLARPRAARSWQPSGCGLDCDIAPPSVAKSRCCSAQSRWVRPRQEARSDRTARTTLRRVAINRRHPRPIVTLHGRELPPTRPNHLGGCGTAHRGWCGGSGAAGSRERPNPDADCKRLHFAHAGRTKPHPRRPKSHGRQHQPDAAAFGADRIDSCIHYPDPSTTGHHSVGALDAGHQPDFRARSKCESCAPTAGDATGQLDWSCSAQLGPDRARRPGSGESCTAALCPKGRGSRPAAGGSSAANR